MSTNKTIKALREERDQLYAEIRRLQAATGEQPTISQMARDARAGRLADGGPSTPIEGMTDRQVAFSCLSLGAKFKYTKAEAAVWVKIGPDLIAGWKESEVATTWLGQPVCSFSDDGDVSALVWLVGECASSDVDRTSDQPDPGVCSHEWIDDGLFMLHCTKCNKQENHDPGWHDMDTAPKDGTLLRLLVEFDTHSTEDADQAPTIGANSFDLTGEDAWQFAGWCWEHDHFTEGHGTPVGWLPFLDTHNESDSGVQVGRLSAHVEAPAQEMP